MRYNRYSLGFISVALCFVLSSCWHGTKESTDTAGKLVVVNVLSPDDYRDVHIKGSISVPLENLEDSAKNWSKDARIVFYCANYMCTSSSYAAKKLTDLGFKDVFAYEGGVAEWKQKGFPLEGPATKAYLENVGQKSEAQAGVKIIDAEALKNEIERAEKEGKLVGK